MINHSEAFRYLQSGQAISNKTSSPSPTGNRPFVNTAGMCGILVTCAGKLFFSEFQPSCSLFRAWLFTEDRLRGLSPTTGDVGISLQSPCLRYNRKISLNHRWLGGLMGDSEDSRGNRDKKVQHLGESAPHRKGETKV